VQRTSIFFAEERVMRPWLHVCPRKRHTARGGLRVRCKAHVGELLPAVLRKRGCPGARELLPFAGAGAHVVGSSAGGLRASLAWQAPASPAGRATISRQEVSGRIGLG